MLFQQQKDLGFKYILTSRINQEFCFLYVDNVVDLIKILLLEHFEPNLTFRILIKHNFMKATELSNCESDNDLNLLSPMTSFNDTSLQDNREVNVVFFFSIIKFSEQ